MNIQLWANFICSLFYIVKIPASSNAAVPRIYFQTCRALLSSPPLSFLLLLGSTYMNPPARPLSLALSLFQYGQSELLFARKSPVAIYAFM